MKLLLALAALLLCVSASAQDDSVSQFERERALAAIKKWQNFGGVWEGDVQYVAAPKPEWLKDSIQVRVSIAEKETRVYTRTAQKDWKEIGLQYRFIRPDELTMLILVYSAQGVWTENISVILTRDTENTANVYLQRVVNNWAGKRLVGEDGIYSDTRIGKLRRQ